MSVYFIMYFPIIIGLFISGFSFYKRHPGYLYARYFLASTCFLGIWLSLYFLSFITTSNPQELLFYSRTMIGTSIVGLYSMLLFFVFFQSTGAIKKHTSTVYIISIFSILLAVSIFTPYVIESMLYDDLLRVYYDSYGALYGIYSLLYLVFLPIFLLYGEFKLSQLTSINRIRLRYILYGFVSFVFLGILFHVILPLFGVRMFWRETGMFAVPFLIMFWYVTYRYHFSSLRVSLGKTFLFLFSVVFSLFLVSILREYIMHLPALFTNFWSIYNGFSLVDLFLGITIFALTHRYLVAKFLGGSEDTVFPRTLHSLQEKIPFFNTLGQVNYLLNTSFKTELSLSGAEIILYQKGENSEIYRYFSSDAKRDFFLNDVVFLAENKNKFDGEKLEKELLSTTGIILPFYDYKDSCIGIFTVGKKPLGDTLSIEEFRSLKSFSSFLQGHIKYLSTYSQIHDLNVNLDKKIDEKTMEYNNLINKQKEFICYISHEIKNPVTNALFLCDSIISDSEEVEKNDLTKRLQEDISILNEEILKVSELTKKIFSIEKYDLGKIQLFKEHTDLAVFIQEEISIFERKYRDIEFLGDIEHVGNYQFDRIQMRQVIVNLIENAIKFASEKNPRIQILLRKTFQEQVEFYVEDNGEGFPNSDISKIFQKYTTGESSSIGLGLGLYLCKKIVDLHGWDIQASRGADVGGARFTITIR